MAEHDGGMVRTELADGVLTVTLDRPARKNAVDEGGWADLGDAFTRAEHDDAVRVVVVTGAAGDFCAGADLSGERSGHPLARMRRINATATALHRLSVPTVAKVRGVAVGAGWNLALGCDLVACSPDARFSQIFARRGLSLDFGGSWLLPHLVGLQQAKRLALLGEILGAEEVRELGLVTWVRPDDELDAHVDDVAARLAAGAPVALAQTKELLAHGADTGFAEALAAEARAQAVNFATADAPAAFAAFRAKVDPEFTGEWLVPPAGSSSNGSRTPGSS